MNAAGEPVDGRPEDDVERRAEQLHQRAAQLAATPLEGIEETAKELASMAGGDLAVVERARRRALMELDADPGPLTRQVVALMRRAIEVGTWSW